MSKRTLSSKTNRDGDGAAFEQAGVSLAEMTSQPFVPGVINIGDAFQPSGVSSASGTITSAGVTESVSPNAGRLLYLWLRGGTSAQGFAEYSNDGGANWYRRWAEGIQMSTFEYSASNGNHMIALGNPEQYDVLVRVRFTSVSGAINYMVSQ